MKKVGSAIAVGLLGAAFVVFAAERNGRAEEAKRKEFAPYAGAVAAVLEKADPPSAEKPQVFPLAAAEGLSAQLLRTLAGVPLHYHATHDEAVYCVSGKGRMRLGAETVEIGPGSVLVIPRGTHHALERTSEDPVVAISVFSPPFDGADRVPVK